MGGIGAGLARRREENGPAPPCAKRHREDDRPSKGLQTGPAACGRVLQRGEKDLSRRALPQRADKSPPFADGPPADPARRGGPKGEPDRERSIARRGGSPRWDSCILAARGRAFCPAARRKNAGMATLWGALRRKRLSRRGTLRRIGAAAPPRCRAAADHRSRCAGQAARGCRFPPRRRGRAPRAGAAR